MPFIDSHCHFDFAEFDLDRGDVWTRCLEKSISSLLIPGVAPTQWEKAKTISEKNDGVYYSIGLHPWWISSYFVGIKNEKKLDLSTLESLVAPFIAPKCLAIGECGLDKLKGPSMALQQAVLEVHLRWCKAYDLPIILHCHKAHAEMLAVLKGAKLAQGGVIHAFNGSMEIAREYIALGFCLGAGGTITYERANKTRKVFASIPPEAYVLETDAPDMPLQGKQGERNSPEHLVRIAQTLADLRGETLEQIEHNSAQNFYRLFRKNK